MNIKMIAAACVAVCSTGAFAAAPKPVSCTLTGGEGVSAATAQTLVTTCSPEITFYSAGATAPKNAIQTVLATDGKVFDLSKPHAVLAVAGDSNQYGLYGYGAAGTTSAGKRVAVIVNGTNGSMAGVNQLLTGLKAGSKVVGVDQVEFTKVMKLHTAADQKANVVMPASDVVSATEATGTTFSTRTKVTLAATRIADFKTAWGVDKQKVAHMAFSDVRPSDAVPGQVGKWAPASFPAETIAMQGFGVVVNTPLYKALQARDIAAGRLASACQDDASAACQPTIFSADYRGLITGKITSAAQLGLADAPITVNRRPDASGTQAASTLYFANLGARVAKTPLVDGSIDELVIGGDKNNNDATINGTVSVTPRSGTGDVASAISAETSNYALGVVSLDGGLRSAGKPLDTASANNIRFVKLDGYSPDANSAGTGFDSKLRTSLQAGYPMSYEFVTLKSAKLAGNYLEIANLISGGLKDPAANLTGMAYIGSTDLTKNTAWTRGGNNAQPINKY